MIKVIKFNDPSQKKFFTSDLHLYHDQEFIWKEEKYQSALDRVNKIRVKINEIVGHKDILFITGDSFLNTTEELVVNFFRSIVCQNIYYVFGNHESSINRLYKKSVQEKYPELPPNTQITPWISPQIPNVTFLGDYAEVIVEGQKIALFHYPIAVHNQKHRGSWNICGHSHHTFPPSRPNGDSLGKVLDVGWGGYKKPLSFDEVKHIMKHKKETPLDHHDSSTN